MTSRIPHAFDVCIIGAGPAGCIAARQLAEAGYQVWMLEEHETVGRPVDCSGIIGTEAIQRLALPVDVVRGTLQQVEFCSPSGQRVLFDPQRILAHIVDRAAFDQALARRAKTAGVHLWTGTTATAVLPDRVGVTIEAWRPDGPVMLRARAVVLANGPRYRLQQQLGMGRPARYLKTVQAEVGGAAGGPVRIFLGSQVSRGSFAWWIPVPDGDSTRVKIGVSAIADSQKGFQVLIRQLAASGELAAAEVSSRSWMIPIAPLPRTYAERVVAVGDAAGQTKPTTGGGLYYGLLCAQLAAEVLADALRRDDLSEAALARYEQQWRAVLEPELRVAARFRRLFQQLSDRDIDRLFRLAQDAGILQRVEQEADFDWHRRLLLQSLRWAPLAGVVARRARGRLAELFS